MQNLTSAQSGLIEQTIYLCKRSFFFFFDHVRFQVFREPVLLSSVLCETSNAGGWGTPIGARV